MDWSLRQDQGCSDPPSLAVLGAWSRQVLAPGCPRSRTEPSVPPRCGSGCPASAHGVPALPRQRLHQCRLPGQNQSQKAHLSCPCLRCADRLLTSGGFYLAAMLLGEQQHLQLRRALGVSPLLFSSTKSWLSSLGGAPAGNSQDPTSHSTVLTSMCLTHCLPHLSVA